MTAAARRYDHDPWLLAAIGGLLVVGLIFVASATGQGDGQSLFARQLLWVVLGAAAFLLAISIHDSTWAEFSHIFYWILVVVLIGLLVFGRAVSGARSWIDLGPLSLQPSEFLKPVLALVVAFHCAESEARGFSAREFFVPMLYVGIPLMLVAQQPDMGTALTLTPILVVAWFLSRIRWKSIAVLAALGLAMMPVLWFGVLRPYQRERVLVTVNPARDPKGAGYQVIQSRIAVGSGGFVGKGLFSGTQSQLAFLPARHTDFIYSVIAEEAGFIGAAGVVALYLLLLQRLLLAAMLARDRLGFFLVMCLCGVFGAHLVLNLGMALGLLPTIGIPLPLLSYGGSSMLATMFALGLCYSVRMRRFVEPE